MKKNILLFLGVAFLVLLATAKGEQVANPDVTYLLVYVNGEPVWEGYCDPTQEVALFDCVGKQFSVPSLERGERAVIKVVFDNRQNPKNLSNVIVRVWLRGAGITLEDETKSFDVYGAKQYIKFLYLEIPENWKADGTKTYTLRVDIEGERKLVGVTRAEIDLEVQRVAQLLRIMSINLKEDSVKAGSPVEGSIVIKNTGNHKLEDVYVKVTVEELRLSRVYYAGDLAAYDNEDEEDTKAVTFSITLPKNINPGVYTLTVEAYSEEVKTKKSIGFVVEKGIEKDIEIVPQVTRADCSVGEEATFSLVITNKGTNTKRITITTEGTEGWATSEIIPASFNLAPEESRLVKIILKVNKGAVAGEHLFTVEVNHNGNKERFNFVANVKGAEKKVIDLKTALLLVGIVLAAIIVVLLIVLLTKKTPEEKPEESYY